MSVAFIVEAFTMCSIEKTGKAWEDVGKKSGAPATIYLSKKKGAKVKIWIYGTKKPKTLGFTKGAKVTVANNFIEYPSDLIG